MNKLRVWCAAVLVAALLFTLPGGVPTGTERMPGWVPPAPAEAPAVPVRDTAARPAPPWRAEHAAVRGETAVHWPAAGITRLALPARSGGTVPVQLTVADRAATAAAGITGVLLRVARDTGGTPSTEVTLEVDYSGFRRAYGGDWASRLRVALLPDGVGGPVRPLATENRIRAGKLTATVPLAGDGSATTLAVSAEPAGENGDYTATSLSPAGTWQVSQQTGDFAWTYPLRVVPGVAGPEPELALSYSSSSIDGRTANTNTQGSWIGDGWDLGAGYIERSYQPCLSDTDAVDGQDPNNKDKKTGDMCWLSDNATMSRGGQATELVRDGNRYRGVDDDGSRIERLTGATNGDDNGEYWKVTTTDGTQYFFGRNRRPAPADAAETDSTWTVPVYGNHSGEPCHAAGFASSRCTQAWRWNLDYVVDVHGNSMTLFYGRETGAYGREADPDLRTTYDRGGFLDRIEYGTRTGSEHSATVPARVKFDVSDRCKPGATCTTDNPSGWPDTPWDQHCSSTPCTDQLAPTFWTQKRLSTVHAQVWRGSGFSDVESWTLRHEYLDAGESDGEGVPMWLRGITRTGHVGTAVSDPEITFDPSTVPLENRVEGPTDGRTALNRWRLHTIRTESGAEIGVSYSARECTRGSLPTPHTNGKRCFPQWYAPDGLEPTLDWFHKYVVTRVDVWDRTGASAQQQTSYEYLDDPAWHYDDSELVKPKKRTWGQWRGYSNVRVRKGLPGTVQSRTDYLYLRGMHGDRATPSGGTKSVQVTDSQGTAVTDHEAHAGFLREETVYNGSFWVSGSINDPWRHGPIATSGPLKAYLTDIGTTRKRTALSSGGTRWTRVTTAFDTTYGMKTQEDDLGDEATGADDRCARYEYARNTSTGLVDKVKRTETVGVRCSATPQRPADVLSDERTFYDDATTHGATPGRGLAVRTQEVGSWSGTSPVWMDTTRTSFDVHGRQVEVSDALNRKTTTTYTPVTGGPVTATATTNPLGHTVTSVMERAWKAPTRTTDANGHVTELVYDGLGRLTKVWLPGRARSETPTTEFAYLVRNTAPSAVTTRKLLPTGSTYQTSVTLYDGQLRERQTQTQAPGGGRAVTDTIYDTRGLVDWKSRAYFTTGGPSNTLVTVSGQPQIPGITAYVYDGAERVTAEIVKDRGVEAWRTSTTYGGDRTHVTPPAGGTAITTVTDARDKVVLRRQQSSVDTTYTYTRRGELASVTAGGNVWTYAYDQRGRQVQATDPDKGTTTTVYDAEGQVTTVTDSRGTTLGHTYDALGRRTSTRDGSPSGTKRAEWVYDTLPNGKGSLTRSIRYEAGAQYVSEVVGYDTAGRATGTRVVVPAAESGLSGTYETSVTYRPDGSIHATELPALGDLPSERLVPAYNEVGAQTSLVSQHASYVYSVAYKSTGELTQRVLGEFGRRVGIAYAYDDATARLTTTSAVPETGAEILDLAYSYDPAGNLLRIADSPGGDAPNDTQCFRYDHLRRLTAAWTPASASCAADPAQAGLGGAAPYWHSYGHDTTGNRLTETRHAAAGDTTTTLVYPAAGSPRPHAVTRATVTGPNGSTLNTYGYDAVGNMTNRTLAGEAQTLTWDAESNLRTVAKGADVTTYIYDADGNRLIRRDATGRTLYLAGGSELRYTAATDTRTGTRYYTHLDVTVAVRTAAGMTLMVTDHHNTGEAAVKASDLSVARRRTTPFGDPRGPVPAFWAGDKGFVGGTQDPTGLTNLGAREYDPALGRFISVDPMVDTDDPQTLNGYAYGNNAPPTFTDPDGLFFKKLWDRATSTVSQAANTAQRVGNAVASGVTTAARATASFATDTVNTIREDPWKFAAEVAVGIAAAAAVAAVCATGVGCVIAAGVVAGALSAGAGYGVDVAQGDRDFSARDLATEMAVGAVVGGATAGVGRFAGGRLAPRFTRGCNSFVPGTAVALAGGGHKPIEQVRLGDRVLATDPETGQTATEEVVATIVGHGSKVLVDVSVQPVDGGAAATVTATDNHPIWVANRGAHGEWVGAAGLWPGDILLAPDGTRVRVLAVVAYGAVATVHNLTVANIHTYYVAAGDADILTHNVGPCPRHPDRPDPNCPACRARTDQRASSEVGEQLSSEVGYRPSVWEPGARAIDNLQDGNGAVAALMFAIMAARIAQSAVRAFRNWVPRIWPSARPPRPSPPRPNPPRPNGSSNGGGGGGRGPNFFI